MIDRPDRLYGNDLQSNYQGQRVALGKHFKREKQEPREKRGERHEATQPTLFSEEEAAGG
jgi:hypothetical protein